MKINNICVYNLYPAILGIRNSFRSKDKSDSEPKTSWVSDSFEVGQSLEFVCSFNHCVIGEQDEKLIRKLLSGKLAHQERKFLRQILVSMDIKGSIKFWAQMDTFKIGTVRNSESTMHSITKGEITQDDFEREINKYQIDYINDLIIDYNIFKNYSNIDWVNYCKQLSENGYINLEHDKNKFLKNLFELIDANLPSGYLLESHWTANYEVLRNIYFSRKDHKMYWWKEFCGYIEKLPYFDLLMKGADN